MLHPSLWIYSQTGLSQLISTFRETLQSTAQKEGAHRLLQPSSTRSQKMVLSLFQRPGQNWNGQQTGEVASEPTYCNGSSTVQLLGVERGMCGLRSPSET